MSQQWRNKNIAYAAGLLLAFLALYWSLGTYFANREVRLQADCKALSDWASTSLAEGFHVDPVVPQELRLAQMKQLQILKTPTGEVIILLKTKITWKQNFAGVFHASRPLTPNDFFKVQDDLVGIAVDQRFAPEPYVTRAICYPGHIRANVSS